MPPPDSLIATAARAGAALVRELEAFTWDGRPTRVDTHRCAESGHELPVLTNEFWTSRQRAAHSLHEVSYRACFKPQLPAFFVRRLTAEGDAVYDPFAGRGTTLLEAALHGRRPFGCDVNPISRALAWPRLSPPTLAALEARLAALDLRWSDLPEPLLAFYHPETLAEICAVRHYLLARQSAGSLDAVDEWLRMVTLNRLTGHSPGFLSVYTLPPNQAVTVEAQRKINARRRQQPPRRPLAAIVRRKSAQLLADADAATRAALGRAGREGRFHVGSCLDAPFADGSMRLIVTSPPFLDVVDYATDNWLRGWFLGIDPGGLAIAVHRRLDDWRRFVAAAFVQFARLLAPGGHVAFEVGEVRGGRVRLEDAVVPCGAAAGLRPVCIVVNDQAFTKTANIWGVSNNRKGTNSNRIVVFARP
jgi:hypothetical protein